MSILEHPLWRKALATLRPSFKIPTRQKLATVLLDQEYEEVTLMVETRVETAEKLTLQLDGWSNCRNEGITNLLVGTPTPFFVDSIETKDKSQDHIYYVDCATKAIENYGASKFVGIVTDNAAPMKKCRKKLKEKYEFLIEYPCAMHGIQLIIGFLIKLPSAKVISDSAKDIVKTIKRSHKLSATFARIQEEKNVILIRDLPL